jgi:two-component system CheB/CheR fusion protein
MVEAGGRDESDGQDPRLREAAFEVSPVPQLVIQRTGTVLLANMQARLLFGLSMRDLGRQLSDLDVSYRPIDLRTPLDRVHNGSQSVSLRDVDIRGANEHVRTFDVHFVPLAVERDGPNAVLIAFSDVSRYKQLSSTVEHARGELETAYEELQSTAEELETTNEELQSTNEELETTNEELQSTNEELETMNEELQSSNEELETLNDELRQRTDDLNHVNLFLESILASLDSAVVVVDADLQVQAWSEQAEELWGLRSPEVVGRHFLGLDIGLPVGELGKPMRRALAGEDVGELELAAVNRRGRSIRCTVTLRALVGPESRIEGLIVLLAAAETGAGD